MRLIRNYDMHVVLARGLYVCLFVSQEHTKINPRAAIMN